jgi:hypothetical protein
MRPAGIMAQILIPGAAAGREGEVMRSRALPWRVELFLHPAGYLS